MQNRNDEARDLVKGIIDEGIVEENIDKTITREGNEIRITKPDNDSIRFDLPEMRKAYVLMSGRLYERDFILDLSDPKFDQDDSEDEKSPALSVVNVESPPILPILSNEEPDKIKSSPLSNESGDLGSESTEPESKPSMVQQLDYKGNFEEVDSLKFKNEIKCECGNIRWVKNADLFQVKKCKPCTYQDRLKRRRKFRKPKGKQEGHLNTKMGEND